MKYIAIFDIPDDYGIGCATAKIAVKGKDRYEDKDFENAYAQVEPLSEEKAEVFERYNVVHRVMSDLGLSCAYDMPSFWCNKGKDYTVIPTKYHKGYMQALEDVEREVRLRFGFSERDNIISHIFNTGWEDGGGWMRDTIYRDDAIRVASGFCHPANIPEELAKLPSAEPEQSEMIKDIRKWINSRNRGNADYFIVDKIEEIINKYER